MTQEPYQGKTQGQPCSAESEELVFAYTAREAVQDGVLVEPEPERFPGWLVTCGVWGVIERIEDDRSMMQRVIPLFMDARMIVRGKPDDWLWTCGLEGNVTGRKVWIARNELGGCTLMFPEEY